MIHKYTNEGGGLAFVSTSNSGGARLKIKFCLPNASSYASFGLFLIATAAPLSESRDGGDPPV